MANAIIEVIRNMNVFGMGSEPIAIAIAAAAAIFLCQKEIKERSYNNVAIAFGINWGMMIIITIGANYAMLAIYWIVVFYLMFFNRKEAEKVVHTVSK